MISVIIPAFNVEKYVEKCLQSVVWQTYKDLEIICINDGSNDETQRILEKYARLDSRVKILIQKNKSVSSARNLGLKNAKAEYIAFVDSDDIIGKNYMQNLWDNREKADCIQVNMKRFSDEIALDKSELEWYKRFNMENSTGLYEITPKYIVKVFMSCWGKLFKKSIIDKYNLKFYEGVIHEDNAWTYEYLIHCKNLYYIHDEIYHYRKRPGSLTYNIMASQNKKIRKIAKQSVYDILKVYIHIAKHFKKYGVLRKYRRALLLMIMNNENRLQTAFNAGIMGHIYIKKFVNLLNISYKKFINLFIDNNLIKIYIQNVKNSKKIDVVSFSRNPVIEKDRFMQKMEKFGLVSFVRNSDFKLKLKSSYNGEVYVWFHPVSKTSKFKVLSVKVNGGMLDNAVKKFDSENHYELYLFCKKNEVVDVEIVTKQLRK